MTGSKKKQPSIPRSTAHVIGYTDAGVVVFDRTMPLLDYFEEDHEWETAAYKKKNGVVKVVGDLFDSDGIRVEHFEIKFSPQTGKYAGGRTEFSDGTVTED